MRPVLLEGGFQRCFNTLLGVFAVLSVSACVVIPTGKTDEGIIEPSVLNSLTGTHRDDLLRKLGDPHYQAGDENGVHFVYRGGAFYTGETALPAPWPLMAAELAVIAIHAAGRDDSEIDKYVGETHCYLFTADNNGIIRAVEEKSGADLNCVNAFFSSVEQKQFERRLASLEALVLDEGDADSLEKIRSWFSYKDMEELENKFHRNELKRRYAGGDDSYQLKMELARYGVTGPLADIAEEGNITAAIDLYEITGNPIPLRKRAELGDSQAVEKLKERRTDDEAVIQLMRYYELAGTDPANAHRWLCRSADRGIADARYTLALIYEHGKEGVKRNYTLAYKWYVLADQAGSQLSAKHAERLAKQYLSGDELVEAKDAIQKWQPGKCEDEIVGNAAR